MYDGLGMTSSRADDDADADLEFDEVEIYRHFVEFFNDIHPEFQKFGEVVQLKVCRNHAQHLRGNVYVQYRNAADAAKSAAAFAGRYYAGRRLNPEFVPVVRWKPAICGLCDKELCPRGKECNFLHVFKNPNGLYADADRDAGLRKNYGDENDDGRSTAAMGGRGGWRSGGGGGRGSWRGGGHADWQYGRGHDREHTRSSSPRREQGRSQQREGEDFGHHSHQQRSHHRDAGIDDGKHHSSRRHHHSHGKHNHGHGHSRGHGHGHGHHHSHRKHHSPSSESSTSSSESESSSSESEGSSSKSKSRSPERKREFAERTQPTAQEPPTAVSR
eukprot:TRINITY_DN913_c0_g1_i1.p1 TRINITY_DN913_c0_g1~~TRINITY_DN913_c0_g1_i1.p1  ORF type:complete len:330 (+),score=56.99 TRINITY_DN913_c0_g1_i1:716-1705(+)